MTHDKKDAMEVGNSPAVTTPTSLEENVESPPLVEVSLEMNDNEKGCDTGGEDESASSKRTCCYWWQFGGVEMAKGYNVLGIGRGALIMSNIFLATSLTYLASEEVGCLEPSDDDEGELVVADDCDAKVYGLFTPSSLVTNIAVISGVLSALCMPVLGAIIDYTPYRRRVGVMGSGLIIAIQAIQIGTVSSTWFYMALLQAFSGFLYQVIVMATYAYLPDIAQIVGEETITKFMPTFTSCQFTAQTLFLLIVIVVSMAFGWGDVNTAQFSQAFNTVAILLAFYLGWRCMPRVPARHVLPEGKRLWLQGFVENWKTAKEINQRYKKGLRWYLLSVIFAEAAASAFTVVSVVFLDEQLKLSGSEVGIFFVISLIGMIPGGMLAQFVTVRTNPKISFCLSMGTTFIGTAVGAVTLNADAAFPFAYIWGAVMGLLLGWYYPTEGLILSMCIPKGKEAELSGIFVYCTQILAWLPPLLFSLLVEANVDQGIGVMIVSVFFVIAIGFMCLSASWNEIVLESQNGGSDVVGHDLRESMTNEEKQPDDTDKEAASLEKGDSHDMKKAKSLPEVTSDGDMEEEER